MTAPGDIVRFARTAARLRPAQVTQRARLRAQRVALQHVPAARRWLLAGPDPAAATGWPPGFTPVDAAVWREWAGLPALQSGWIELLGMSRQLASPATATAPATLSDPDDSDSGGLGWLGTDWAAADWAQPGAPLLWRFHLQYWDWAWALAADAAGISPEAAVADTEVIGVREWFTELWASWQAATTAGRGDAWLPYPASLRAWSWCGLYRPLVAGTRIEQPFTASLATHAGFLRRHLETDVGGNHLIKNLKALAGLGVFFADERLLDGALGRLRRQLAVQVLPDGGHYERAPAYHCQVLADLIDVAGLLRLAGREPAPELTEAIRRMRHWLGCILSPAREIPLLNDGYPVSPALLTAVRPDPTPADPLLVLPDSGLARLTAGRWHVLTDIGAPCPDDLPGHAHADTLSCLVSVDGMPMLVDTCTSGYAAGPVRSYERSTAAHNTVTVDGADSTEVWGAFRAARLARVSGIRAWVDGSLLTVEAGHDGFRRLPGRPRHHRRWSLTPAGLRVDDLVSGGGRHEVTVHWHLAPDTQLRLAPGGAVASTRAGEFRIGVQGPPDMAVMIGFAPVAHGFGRSVTAPVLTCRVTGPLPVRLSTQWLLAARAYPAASEQVAADVAADAVTVTDAGATADPAHVLEGTG